MTSEIHLITQEQGLAEESFSTSAPLRMASKYIRFPVDVRGKYVLDVGGGASTATLELRRQGAVGYAIDYRYNDFRSLRQSVDKWLNQLVSSSNVPSNKQLKNELEKEIEMLGQKPLPGANPTLWSLTSKLTADYIRRMPIELLRKQIEMQAASNRAYAKVVRGGRDYFFGSLDRDQRPYVAALSGNLPFTDGSFDFVFSLLAVSFFLTSDGDVFMKSIQEMVRVLKPGGELQIHPWIGNPVVNWTEQQRASFTEIHQYLSTHGLYSRIEPVNPVESPRLRLVKS